MAIGNTMNQKGTWILHGALVDDAGSLVAVQLLPHSIRV
jgi:hypothetical protein